jgi:hypothetical protein
MSHDSPYLADQNRETHREPVKVRDASNGVQTRFKIYCNCAPGDNPSQSETSGHIGGKGNYPCRKCKVGGTQLVRETNAKFHESFSVSLILWSIVLYHLKFISWSSLATLVHQMIPFGRLKTKFALHVLGWPRWSKIYRQKLVSRMPSRSIGLIRLLIELERCRSFNLHGRPAKFKPNSWNGWMQINQQYITHFS